MFLNNKMESVGHKIQDSKDTLVAIEDKTGIRRDDLDEDEADFERLELGKVTRILTSLISKLVHNKYNCQLQQSMISFLQETNACHNYSNSLGKGEETKRVVEERLSYFRSWVQFNELRAAYLTERADSQKQTVSMVPEVRCCGI